MGVVVLAPREVLGTVEEQRARLPPPAECTDPVEGIWMSLSYARVVGEWYDFTLDIRRAAPGSDELKGEITSHFWNGVSTDPKPPACTPGGLELVVKMPARGKVADDAGKSRVFLGGTTYTNDRAVCGRFVGYNPDTFEGTIDPKLQEFQSLNNDGGIFRNEPAVFRRVRCLEPPRKQALDVKPPDFAPAKRTGCGS
jgi:hypothetical protein